MSANPTTLDTLYYNLAGRIDQFLLGMIAAWLFIRHRHRERFRGWWKVGVAGTAAVAMLWVFNQVGGFNANGAWRLAWVDIEGGVWALVVLTYVTTCQSTGLAAPTVARFGELSFSAYLLHMLVVETLIRRRWWIEVPGLGGMENAMLTTVLIVLPVLTVVSMLSYHGIERPFLRFRVKYLDLHALPPLDRPVRLPAQHAKV
ncbi:hypothetical protein [Alloactinosynnema sp. L-07]|uniref:acyltransferase family protein n=1 Tax=Alloactinosynnema sp. L-07 TaxID=1653480 RepID=UPI00065EF11F|nr:acyltransferase [Alloactinosynnema sp. L-07]CRK59118.1 hypothetical protein [Alloactinosynnema sp. L-07]